MYVELYLKLTQYQVKLIFIERAKINSERQFSHLVSHTYTASL